MINMNNPTRNVVSACQARTHLGGVLDTIRYSKRPCYIERHGKIIAALVDIESYQRSVLPEQYRQWLQQALDAIIPSSQPEKVILFGSVLSGEMHEGSDIDLLIVKKTRERVPDRIEQILQDLPDNLPVEPHVFTPQEIEERTALKDPFLLEALKGRILYEAPK